MLQRYLLYITFISVLLFQSCRNETIPIQKIELNDTSDLSITNWKLIGPFQTDIPHWIRSGPFNKDSINGAVLFEKDNFQLFGLNEADVRANDISTLQLIDTNSIFTVPDTLLHDYHNLHGMIDLHGTINTNKPGNIYVACILKCKKEQDVVFLAGGDESARLYVNGKLYESPVQNPFRLVYQNYIFAHLSRGNNFILLKLSNTIKSWVNQTETGSEQLRYIFNMCSPKRFNDYYLKLEKMLIKKPVVPFQHPLTIYTPVHPIDFVLSVEIRDINDSVVLAPEYNYQMDINSLDFGWYNMTLTTNRNIYNHDFYYGDIYSGIKPYVQQAKKLLKSSTNESLHNNLGALVKRHDILHNYYMGNYFKISETNNNRSFSVIDTFVTNPTRLIPLNNAKSVMLETVKLWRNPIAGIEFYNQKNDDYEKIAYIQSNKINQIKEGFASDTNIILSPSNDPFLDTLYFGFNSDECPEYMQLLTYDTLNNREIDRRYIFLYKEIRDILTSVEKNIEPFKNVPGTHLRAFTSDVEEQEQYYIVQAPESIKHDSTPKPLIVVVPWVFNANYPFLRSFIVADIHIHEMYQWQVNLRDFIVVHSNARTYKKIVTEPLSINNVLRTINQVKTDYHIDTSRIHLLAYCGGSELATSIAAKFPGNFASLGIVAGFTVPPGNRWTESIYPINFTENLNNLPIRIRHGELDKHTHPASIMYFVDVARKNGNDHIDFLLEKGLTFEAYPRLRHHEEMFDFFNLNSVKIPNKITFSTALHKYHKSYWLSIFPQKSGAKATITASIVDNYVDIKLDKTKKCLLYVKQTHLDKQNDINVTVNGINHIYSPPIKDTLVVWNTDTVSSTHLQKNRFTEGPLLDVYSNKFIIVKGTLGSETQKNAISMLIDQFVTNWEDKYHVTPLLKNDFEITDNDFEHSNIILYGNQNTNLIAKKLYGMLPFKITPEQVTLDTKVYQGTSLGYWIVYPNPLNRQKYIVLVGGNDLSKILPRKGIPALNGYFDYEIYSYNDGYQYILDNGYFNENWKYGEQ